MRARARQAIDSVSRVILGKPAEVRLSFACLLSGGHLLLEDLPGTGKTTLALALGRALGLKTRRIQFTSDLLPGDVIGGSVFRQATGRFEFHPGPVFAELVLADELNRASPRTQSACLQAMEEGAVTVDGERHALPEPCLWVATQNPRGLVGTHPLPESQIDRFLMRVRLGYPDRETLAAILAMRALPADSVTPSFDAREVAKARADIEAIRLGDWAAGYLCSIRERIEERGCRLSVRATLALARAGRAIAWLEGREFAVPEDFLAVAEATLLHRIEAAGGEEGADWLPDAIRAAPVP